MAESDREKGATDEDVRRHPRDRRRHALLGRRRHRLSALARSLCDLFDSSARASRRHRRNDRNNAGNDSNAVAAASIHIQPKGTPMFASNLNYQRQVVADRHDLLRREAGASRLRRDVRKGRRRVRPGPAW